MLESNGGSSTSADGANSRNTVGATLASPRPAKSGRTNRSPSSSNEDKSAAVSIGLTLSTQQDETL
jgi:hypothetical protein